MRVAVIGGGVVGLSCARALAAEGAEVVVVERGVLGGGCSAGNGGWICPSISVPLPSPALTLPALLKLLRADSPLHIKASALPHLAPWLLRFRRHCNQRDFEHGTRAMVALAAGTLASFDELEAAGVQFEQQRRGLLMVFHSQAALDEELRILELTGYGEKIKRLSPEELMAAEPALAGSLAGGILAVPERHVRPETLCAGLTQEIRQQGVEIVENAQVERLIFEGAQLKAVATSSGSIGADRVVIATGAEAGRLAAQAGSPLPMQAGKGYSITVDGPRTPVKTPLYITESKLAITPFEGALRVSGTMELSGINTGLDPGRLRTLERAAEREMPGVFAGDSRRDWVGMRPITPDGLPVIGRLPGRDTVFVASGHQMLGITLGPGTGKAVAGLVMRDDPGLDLTAFDPGRF